MQKGQVIPVEEGLTQEEIWNRERNEHEINSHHKWGMVIDLARCIGCHSCTAACKAENGTPAGIDWNVVWEEGEADFPEVEGPYLPRPCMNCEDPPCTEVCPVRATFQRDDGIVWQDYSRCIGCRYCMTACPYGVRYFNWEEPPEWPDNAFRARNPRVRLRFRGIVEKCLFCHHRVDPGVKKGLTPGKDREATPACVNVCPVEARIFGDLNDPLSRVSRLIRSKRAFRLKENVGTKPQVYYLPAGEWQPLRKRS